MIEDRKYMIIGAEEVSLVNFNEVCETSAETLRYSVDKTKTFIKWDNEQPVFLDLIQSKEGPYTQEEILAILSTEEWTNPSEMTI